MARAGGQSTAAGVSFQALAVARAIIDAYQGRIESVRAEVPPNADFGRENLISVDVDDFVTQQTRISIYHQAKSNAPGDGKWTVNKLWREEILQKFKKQLAADPTSECCLVTPSDCPLLGKIAGAARDAASAREFNANLTAEDRKLVGDAGKKLGADNLEIHGLLRRCRLKIRTSQQFEQELEALAGILFADPIAAVDCLHTMAMRAMKTGQPLGRSAIDATFSERSVFAKPKATKEELLTALTHSSSRLRTVGKDIANVHVLQPTVDKLVDWAKKQDPVDSSVAVLLDQAGSGKTVAMSVLLERLERAGFATLGVKVDGLAFSSQEELASAIGLPDSIPSVLQSLHASGHRIALLIDQVDALSSAMSRESSGITAIVDLVARLGNLRIPIVLACRSFDWKYDHRLKHLREKRPVPVEFTLPELTDDQLSQVLSVCSVKVKDLHPLTVKVIRCPLRLKVLVEIIQSHRKTEPSWEPESAVYTLQTLYHDFWSLKLNKAISDGVDAADCEAVAVALAQSMHVSERLSAPEATVVEHREARNWLISEDVLRLDGTRLSFFHQTFFDFVFARAFVGEGRSLVDNLLESDQGLFYRPMVRQILEYLRDASPRRFVMELRGILEHAEIRKHLRWLAIAWMGQLHDPRLEELNLLEAMLAEGKTRQRILGYLRGNVAWFDLLTTQRFDRWFRTLTQEDIWHIGCYLHSIVTERQQQVATLLSPHLGESDAWNNQVAFCLAQIKTGWADCSADLLSAVMSNPLTNLDAEQGWWSYALESLAKSLPARACDAIGIALNRFTERWTKSEDEADGLEAMPSDEARRLPQSYGFTESLNVLAKTAPADFLEAVLSWTLVAMQNSCYSYSDHHFKDNWRYWRTERDIQDTPTGKLLAAIGDALKALAKTAPSTLRAHVPQLLASQCLPMQLAVAEAYEENPAEFATDAANFLVSDPRRLRLCSEGSRTWRSTQLMRACCPWWSQEDFGRVETAILGMEYYPAKTVDALRWRGTTHLVLLQALDRRRLGQDGLNRLGQLERKFPGYRQLPPQDTEMHCVGAPITPNSIERMDDEAWLGAMRKHTKGWEAIGSTDDLRGGRVELSRSLQEVAKKHPDRFLRLAMERMDQDIHVDYIHAIISGIAEAGVPMDRLEDIIQKFLPLLERNDIGSVAWALDKYAGKNVPQSLCNVLEHWVEHAPKPTSNGESPVGTQDRPNDEHLLHAGMNTDRGASLWSLSTILMKADPPRRKEYLDLAEQVVQDRAVSVRAVCLRFLHYAMPAAPARACQLFRRIVGKDSRLLRERGTYDFVYCSLPEHAMDTMWAVVTMLVDVLHPEAQEAGARLACLAAFECPAAASLRDLCLSGNIAMRKGAATVYSANAFQVEVGAECRERLPALMNDEAGEVRTEATGFLRDIDATCLRDMADFVRLWPQTKSLEEGADSAARMLEQCPVTDPRLTLDLSERLIDVLARHIASNQGRHGSISHHLTPAILNVYHRSIDPEMRRRAIDLFEKLEEMGCSEVRGALESADRL